MPDDTKKPRPRQLGPRKLLVAAVGVATVNYLAIACGGKESSSGGPTSGNLPAPNYDAADQYIPPTSGNLPAPPPPVDSGTDADASDASDAADADDDGG
jgi:hypothetical protein